MDANFGEQVCPNCHDPLDRKWNVCPSCGTKIAQQNICPKCRKEIEQDWKTCPYCESPITGKWLPPIAIKDSVVREIHQTQQTEIREAKGATIGGNINIFVGPDAQLNKSSSSPEYQYEQHVITQLKSGAKLENQRPQLEEFRAKLGLTLKQTRDIEAQCSLEFNKEKPDKVSAINLQSKTPPQIPAHAKSERNRRKLPIWAIGACGVVVIGVIVGVIYSNSIGHTNVSLAYIPPSSSTVSVPLSGEPNQPAQSSSAAPMPQYNLNVSVTPNGGGTISPYNSNYNAGAGVTLTAIPAMGFKFSSWSGDLSNINPNISISMDSNKSITANFVAIQRYTLSISVDPQSGGSISPSGGTYDGGSHVTIVAAPSPGYRFESWSGTSSGTNTTLDVTMNSNQNVVAKFVAIQYNLTTSINPPGGGSVNPNIGNYNAGQQIILSASPNSGYKFSNWSGDVSESSSSISFTIDSNKNVTANFRKYPDVVIQNVTMPNNPHVTQSWYVVPYAYNTILKITNNESTDITINWKANSTMTGNFDQGSVTIPKYGTSDITKTYKYTNTGSETVTYTLYYNGVQIDSWSGTITIIP